jgi:CO/xanthine dehydrogenase Mo-binding subunit/aerobic-type carbon monoxide dehydrogenase small subunit (CoxS/CutS family)
MNDRPAPVIEFSLNGKRVIADVPGIARLADVLRDVLGATGTKIGCNAGDCGACTVLINGRQVCACLTPVGQVTGKSVVTVEGLADNGVLSRVQRSFHRHGAAQCGICTPGMLIAATDLLSRNPRPTESEVMESLGGVLCRCTGYRKIIEAVIDAENADALPELPAAGRAIGARSPKVDGLAKLTGSEYYGADEIPSDALWLRVVRSSYPRARFTLGDFTFLFEQYPGLVRVLTAKDVPSNGFGIYPEIKDQPVLADGEVRFTGEAVVALVGERACIEAIPDAEIPIAYDPEAPLLTPEAALAEDAPRVHSDKPGNILVEGRVRCGDPASALAACGAIASGEFRTSFVEHAYIEPEAGWARRTGNRLEVRVTTQTPYMDRDELAGVLHLAKEQVRIIPTACGGGFGGKLDLSVQPLIGLAAWLLDRPVACIYQRPESMAATTKRHPAHIKVRFGADMDGRLTGAEVDALFNTGAYASWGPTVANRVPVHAMGPYRVGNVRTSAKAIFTHNPPAGAFRGFGVPQAAIAHEAMMDDLAALLNIDRWEIRRRNALEAGDKTACGQLLSASCGLPACLDALKPHWDGLNIEVCAFNATSRTAKRGVGIGCMWYGIGNTSMSNPSTIRVGLSRTGKLTLYNGAADIGQGTNTTLMQVCADALGLPMAQFSYIMGDTDLTADAGKSSASRQAFVSGNAALRAGRDLRAKILSLAHASERASITLMGAVLRVRDGGDDVRSIRLTDLAPDKNGDVLWGEGCFDPPTTPLDENGQGVPYATYAFAAQIAVVEVDLELGTTQVLRMVAAHDVGKALNPQQVEGQIHGGIAQGIGMALMEEYLPGKTDNLHDYLIPTIGDVPPIDIILIEDPEPFGPCGAKGVGEPALIPAPPAILGAIRHATGVRLELVPVTPHRLRAALVKSQPPASARRHKHVAIIR